MTMKQFRQAYQMAESLKDTETNIDERNQALCATSGCYYDKVYCTMKQYAIYLNYQTMQMNGIRSTEAVNDEIHIKDNIIIIDRQIDNTYIYNTRLKPESVKTMSNVKRKVIVSKLNLPVDDYSYDVKLLTSIDNGDTYYYAGFGKFARTLKEAEAIKKELEQDNAIYIDKQIYNNIRKEDKKMKRSIYKIQLVNASGKNNLMLAEAYSKGIAYIVADKMKELYHDFDATVDVTKGSFIEYRLMTKKAIEKIKN